MANKLAAGYLNDQTLERRMIRHLASQVLDGHRLFEERDREIDGKFDMPILSGEVAPILDRPGHHELRQRAEVRIGLIGYEIGWWDRSPIWVTHAHQRFGAAQCKRADFDFRLVP